MRYLVVGFFVVVYTALMISAQGCAAIDGRKLEKDIANYTQTIDTICTTAELFEAVGKPVPGVEQCKQALKTADLIQSRSDVFAVAAAVRCVEKSDKDVSEIARCVDRADIRWLPIVLDRINDEIKKQID